MTASPAPVSSPPAIAAFVRGVGQRARLLAIVQAGASTPANQALAVVAQVFASEAGQWPIAQWPQQYWRLLLATPHLRQPGTPQPGGPLPGIARLPPTQRAAILLQLVAGLDDATAATALGTPVSAYQDAIRDGLPLDALGRPDLDVWRAWRAAVQRELANALPAPDTRAPTSRTALPAIPACAADAVEVASQAPRHHVRWLWLGVVICVLGFAATFFLHPVGRAVLQRWHATITVDALPVAATPKARFDSADIASHPDRDWLAAPQEAGFASQLPLFAWLAVETEDLRAADPVQLPISTSPVQPTRMDPLREAATIAARVRQWDAMPARQRGMRRGQWQAWQALSARERIQLRGIARRWFAMDPDRQQAIRARFQAQPSDARNGWWLGPTLGRDWARIQALFAYVAPGQRSALLQLLRETDQQGWDVLARLAQTTPPEAREKIRTELLEQAPSQRGAWLREQLAR